MTETYSISSDLRSPQTTTMKISPLFLVVLCLVIPSTCWAQGVSSSDGSFNLAETTLSEICCGEGLCALFPCSDSLTCAVCTNETLSCQCNGVSIELTRATLEIQSRVVALCEDGACINVDLIKKQCLGVSHEQLACSSCTLCETSGGKLGYTSDCDNLDPQFSVKECLTLGASGTFLKSTWTIMTLLSSILLAATW